MLNLYYMEKTHLEIKSNGKPLVKIYRITKNRREYFEIICRNVI